MDTNEAWERFRGTSSVYKTSSAEKLDTLAAAVNNLQTTVSRLATTIPGAQGDAAAIDAANAAAPMMPPGMEGMGGMPPEGMGGMPDDMGAPDMGMPMGGEDPYGDMGYGDEQMADNEKDVPPMGDGEDLDLYSEGEGMEEPIVDEMGGEGEPDVEEPVPEMPEAPEMMPEEAPVDLGGGAGGDPFYDKVIALAASNGDKDLLMEATQRKLGIGGGDAMAPGIEEVAEDVPGAEAMGPENGTDEEFLAYLESLLAENGQDVPQEEMPQQEEMPALKSASVTKGDVGAINSEAVAPADNGEQATPDVVSGVAADQNTSDATGMATASASGDDGSLSEGPVAKSSMEGSPDPNSMYSTDTDGLPLDSIVNLIHSRSGSGRFEIAKSGCEKTTTECGDVNAPLSNSSTEAVTNSNCEEDVTKAVSNGTAKQKERVKIMADRRDMSSDPRAKKLWDKGVGDAWGPYYNGPETRRQDSPQDDIANGWTPEKGEEFATPLSSRKSDPVEKSAEIEETGHAQEDLAANPQGEQTEILPDTAESNVAANPQPTKDDEATIAASDPVDGEHHTEDGKTEGDPKADADDNMDEAATRKSASDMSITDMIVGRIGEGRGFVRSVFPDGVEKSAKIEETSQPEEDLARKADTDPEEIESAGQAEAALSANPQPTKDDEETIESSSPVDGEHHDTEGVEKAEPSLPSIDLADLVVYSHGMPGIPDTTEAEARKRIEARNERKEKTEPAEKSEGAMTSGTPGAVNPVYGDEITQAAPAATAPKQASAPAQTAGRTIPSMREMLASVHKSTFVIPASRPDVRSVSNGEITHDPSQVRKSVDTSSVRMGHGVDPYEVVRKDWEEYRIYKAKR